MNDPLVSILVPTYNGERFLRATLRSALEQTYRSIEVIVGDDGSTDGTPEILAAVGASDQRVRVIRHEPNIGPLENPRHLLGQARGEYVKYLMHDDVLAADCVRELLRGMQANPETTMAFSHRVLISEDGRPVPDHQFPKLRDRPGTIDGRQLGAEVLGSCTNVIGEPTTVLFRRDAVSPEDLWSLDGRTVDVLNDVQLWLTLLARGPAFYTPRTLSRFRRHSGQNTHNPKYLGRGERDWSRLADWGARNGFFLTEMQERRAHARALLEAAARLNQVISGPNYGATLEAAFLSTARLVELATATPIDPRQGLPDRAHGRSVLGHFAQELDVWTQVYPFALAAPALEQAEISGTVQALREVLAAGVAERVLLAVPTDSVDDAVPLVEDALAEGSDIDIEMVPTDTPATLLPDPWLAVVPQGATWHHGRSLAMWTFPSSGADPAPAPAVEQEAVRTQ
jgi:glycosyltransferase involved in cell wall biosynthesis